MSGLDKQKLIDYIEHVTYSQSVIVTLNSKDLVSGAIPEQACVTGERPLRRWDEYCGSRRKNTISDPSRYVTCSVNNVVTGEPLKARCEDLLIKLSPLTSFYFLSGISMKQSISLSRIP